MGLWPGSAGLQGAVPDQSQNTTAVALQMAAGPDPMTRLSESAAWWSSFWARSYISTPQPPPVPRVGVFPCTGSASQTVLMAPNGSLTLPGGQCLAISGQNQIVSLPCAKAPAGEWTLVQCTTPGCDASGDYYVAFNSTTAGGETGSLPQVCTRCIVEDERALPRFPCVSGCV